MKNLRLTFKEFLHRERKKDKKKNKGNQYPTRGVKDIVNFDKERTHKSYRATNAVSAPVSGVGGMGGM